MDSRTTTIPRHALPRRRSLSRHVGFNTIATIFGAAFLAASAPTPIYGIWQAHWHFSLAMLTVIFAVYALGVLTALLTCGRLSDEVGRRPVLLAALGCLVAVSAIFAVADSPALLLVGRVLQGLATGSLIGAASAALIDLDSSADHARAGVVSGAVNMLGLAFGAMGAAALVQYAPAPRELTFIVQGTLFAVLAIAAWFLPEPVSRGRGVAGGWHLQPPRLRVPEPVLRTFTIAAFAMAAAWTVGGLFLSLGPTLAAQELHTTNSLAGGGAEFALAFSGTISQALLRRRSDRFLTTAGALVLAAGLGVIVVSLAHSMGCLFFPGTVIGGLGWGVLYTGGLRLLATAAPAHQRGEVMSALYAVAYLSMSVPAVIAGLLVSTLGLTETFRVFGLAVIVISLLLTAGIRLEARRTWRADNAGNAAGHAPCPHGH